MATVEKALILAAGFGTRRLPITKAIEKCMMPVNERPVVDYVVEDCIKAGAQEITFVVGSYSHQLRTYYGHNLELENYLIERNKTKMLEQILAIGKKATFRYMRQEPNRYGTAVPVAMFDEYVGPDEQVFVATSDDFVHNLDGISEMAHLLDATSDQGSSAGLLVAEASDEDISHYGAVRTDRFRGGYRFESIVEKPQPGTIDSRFINISKYLFDKNLFGCAVEVVNSPPAANGEYLLTKALESYTQAGGNIAVAPAHGQFFDCGNKLGWLAANKALLSA